MSLRGLHSTDSLSFTERYTRWHDVLDLRRLLASEVQIQKCNALVESWRHENSDDEQDEKVTEAVKLCEVTEAMKQCEASVHPDTGNMLPLIFRPPAFTIIAAPMVVATLIPHRTVLSVFLCQIPFQLYTAGFTLANSNQSLKDKTLYPIYMSVSILYLTCVGAFPQFAMKRFKLTSPTMQNFFGRILPTPLFAILGALNVTLMRSSELDNGIQVLDRAGNVVGVSHKAGKKAVKETALSRSALFGFTALIPSLMKRSPLMLQNPRMFNILKHIAAFLSLGAMTPVSFSIFPQKGKIKREKLEDELKEKTTESELFYNRGV